MEGKDIVGKIILTVMFGIPMFLIAMQGMLKDWNRMCLNRCAKVKRGMPTSTLSNLVCRFYHCRSSVQKTA